METRERKIRTQSHQAEKMIKTKRVAIIETGGSHEEIIYPQLIFLNTAGYTSNVVLRKDHLLRFKGYNLNEKYFLVSPFRTVFHKVLALIKIIRFLKKQKIQYLILNTSQGAFIRDLCMFLPSKINVTGISHNPQKFGNSFTMRIISSRVKKFFVLNDYILDNMTNYDPSIKFESLYPVFYNNPLKKSAINRFFNIVIPGAFDMNRRDYKILMKSLSRTTLHPEVRLVFLGRSNSTEANDYFQNLANYISIEQFIHFHDFIPDEEFFKFICEAELILPLITPEIPLFELYKNYKISGAVNLSFGFKIPMLMHSSLQTISDFQDTCIFYNDSNLTEIMNTAFFNRMLITQCADNIKNNVKFNVEYQKNKYLTFMHS